MHTSPVDAYHVNPGSWKSCGIIVSCSDVIGRKVPGYTNWHHFGEISQTVIVSLSVKLTLCFRQVYVMKSIFIMCGYRSNCSGILEEKPCFFFHLNPSDVALRVGFVWHPSCIWHVSLLLSDMTRLWTGLLLWRQWSHLKVVLELSSSSQSPEYLGEVP